MEITVGKYRTRDGLIATVHAIKLRNDMGELVSFPVKGSVQKPRYKNGRKGTKPYFIIWTLGGKYNLFSESKLDLVERID